MKYENVFVMYARGFRTGGVEALHQLVDAIRSLGGNAWLVPYADTADEQLVRDYRQYNADERVLEDKPGNLVVFPEARSQVALSLRRMDAAIWWLSFDNWDLNRGRVNLLQIRRGTKRARRRRAVAWARRPIDRERQRRFPFDRFRHFSQSLYASSALLDRFGVSAEPLSDYLGSEHVLRARTGAPAGRVAFNPQRSGSWIERIAPLAQGLTFVPLEGLSSEGLAAAFAASDVYLDVGFHPGKDRLPREAALAGCVIAVARRGSAAFDIDVPLPPHAKVSVAGDLARNAADALRKVFDDIERARAAQEPYIRAIEAERAQFLGEVKRAFFADEDPPGIDAFRASHE